MAETTPQAEQTSHDLSTLVIPLLKGVLYQDDARLWNALLNLQARVRDYVSVLGLELVLDEAEGYAFLRSRLPPDDEEAAPTLPRLVARRPLSFPVSLLLALLRKKLAEFDASGGDTRLVLSRDDVVELIRVFLPDSSNEAKLIDQIETHLNKIVELGFLRRLKTSGSGAALFEVQRIIKAFVDAQWLADFDQRLAGYQAQFANALTPIANAVDWNPLPQGEGRVRANALDSSSNVSSSANAFSPHPNPSPAGEGLLRQQELP